MAPKEAPTQAEQAQTTQARQIDYLETIKNIAIAMALLTLAASASPVSQATLTPVFGAIPCSVNHQQTMMITPLLGFLLRWVLRNRVPTGIGMTILAHWTFYIPIIQLYLFRYSGEMGPVFGPALLGFLSCHMIVIPASYTAAERLEAVDLEPVLGSPMANLLPYAAMASYVPVMERLLARLIPFLRKRFGLSMMSPVNLQMLMALSTYLTLPSLSPQTLPIAGSIFHALTMNPHMNAPQTTELMNNTLHAQNWSLVDRAWSTTGYISVLESQDLNHKVMRCDHSLLGGEWLLTDERREKEGWKVAEPIYSVFEMLEAVRLLEVSPPKPDSEANALVIGLGIGTAPKAMMEHGISTTVIEVDPVVHRFATQYFDLPGNHTAYFQDAVKWVEHAAKTETDKYDYIIHDVFTGGVEPLPLFTLSFITNLRSLLATNGVAAINYAGDLTLPLTQRILNTGFGVFDGQCKMYRDEAPVTSQKDENTSEHDFLNMVIFCRNSPGSITFRKPTSADFLGSKSREHYLLPRPDFEISFPGGSEVLMAGEEGKWTGSQVTSALRHWHIMRKVMPDAVWELW